MDPETAKLWDAWCDRRIRVAIEAEREHFEQRLHNIQVEIYDIVREAFETNSAATTKFVERVVEEGITRSAQQAKRLLSEFHSEVRDILEHREGAPPPADPTIN
jgi:hypothetical protein